GSREGISATRADGDKPVVRFNKVSVARDQKGILFVGYNHYRFQMAQRSIGPPVFCQFDRSPAKVSMKLLQLGLETREQSETVGGRPSKPRNDLVVVEPPDLLCTVFDDGIAQRYLSIAGDSDFAVFAD